MNNEQDNESSFSVIKPPPDSSDNKMEFKDSNHIPFPSHKFGEFFEQAGRSVSCQSPMISMLRKKSSKLPKELEVLSEELDIFNDEENMQDDFGTVFTDLRRPSKVNQSKNLSTEFTEQRKPKRKKSSTDITKMVHARHKYKIREALNITTRVIIPEDSSKTIWTAIVLILLLYATLVTPYRVAFIDKDPFEWIIVDSIVDVCFLIDLILNMFFFAYYDKDQELIFDRKKIIKRYLRTWFLIDFVAIIPFNAFYGNNYNSLSRLARLPRLYRLLKITRILKTLRVCREKNKWMEYAPNMSLAGERLVAFMLIIFVLIHVSACMWYLGAKIEGIYPNSWVIRYSYQDSSNFEIYTASFYFIITTITTVGYGDISPATTWERWFGIIIMVTGVMSYSFMISSLSSLLTNDDIQKTNKNLALESLHRIDVDSNLDTGLFLRVKKAIIKKFKEVEYIKNQDALMHLLPRRLKGDLNAALHESLVRKIDIFKHEEKEFVEYLARLLRAKKYKAEEIICKEGEKNDEIYFIIKGCIEYVLPEFNDIPYQKLGKGERFGDLEIVHLFLTGKRLIEGKRIFTAKAKKDSEIFILSQTDLLALYHKFEKQVESIFIGADIRLKYSLELKEKTGEKLRRRYSGMNKIVKRMSTSLSSRDNKYHSGYTRELSASSMGCTKTEGEFSYTESLYSEISGDTDMMSEYRNNYNSSYINLNIHKGELEINDKDGNTKSQSPNRRKPIFRKSSRKVRLGPRNRLKSSIDFGVYKYKPKDNRIAIHITEAPEDDKNIIIPGKEEIRSLASDIDENMTIFRAPPISLQNIHSAKLIPSMGEIKQNNILDQEYKI